MCQQRKICNLLHSQTPWIHEGRQNKTANIMILRKTQGSKATFIKTHFSVSSHPHCQYQVDVCVPEKQVLPSISQIQIHTFISKNITIFPCFQILLPIWTNFSDYQIIWFPNLLSKTIGIHLKKKFYPSDVKLPLCSSLR